MLAVGWAISHLWLPEWESAHMVLAILGLSEFAGKDVQSKLFFNLS